VSGAATARPTRVDSAVAYARRGWPVLPLHTVTGGRCSCGRGDCASPGKHPLTAHGLKSAVADEPIIREWWARWPDANVGIATGPASGLLVLDVDPRHGGDETLAELEARYGKLPDTVEALTGGGGRHLLFQHPGGSVGNSAGKLGFGLDIRADGGYIVAPPSRHVTGRPYEWDVSSHPDDVPIAPAPAWLLELLRPACSHGTDSTEARDWLKLLQGARDGQRHAVAAQIAGHYLGIGWRPEEVEGRLLGFAAQCTPPYTKREEIADIKRIVKDLAAKDGARKNALDPLAPLRALGEELTLGAVEAALRAMLGMLNGADPLTRARARGEAIAILKTKHVGGPAAFVDAAMSLLTREREEAANGIFLADPEPWPKAVDGPTLLAEIERTLARFVVMPPEAAMAVALWTVYAHAYDSFDISPILSITSPTMRCGKTLLLQIIGALVPKALATSNITPAALFRSIETYRPTLLIDEGDSFLTLSEEMRGLLNSGHTRRGAVVIRTVGEDFEPRRFSTWCPKVIALIGKLPATLSDRSITIQMRRKSKVEGVERFRHQRLDDLALFCRQAARWVADHIEVLRAADPVVPEQLNDRMADNWRPLVAIADAMEGGWPNRARTAALALAGANEEDESASVMLIHDIVLIFREQCVDRLSTADLLAGLLGLEERPWREWKHGKPITPRQLAGLLAPFNVFSKTIRVGDATPKGYAVADFTDAFSRYLASESATTPQSATGAGLQAISYPQHTPSVADEKSDLSIRIQRNDADVADRNPEILGEAVCATVEEGVQ